MNEYIAMWKNYVNFSDRTTRRGYWMAFLFNFIVALVLGIIVAVLPFLSFVSTLYSLATLVPGIAIVIRRLRDAGKAWAWIFIALIPLIGEIILIVLLCKQSVVTEENANTAVV